MADPATELVSGARRIGGAALDERVRRAAAGLAALGVARGDCVAILMRNDIAFIETAYAAQTLGAYAVPVNWHFKAEEIVYILGDCGARVLVGHADLLAPVAAALPKGVAVIAVATPPEVASAYGIAPVPPSAVPGAQDYEAWLAAQAPHRGEMPSPPLTMFYTSGTTGHPKGVRRPAPTPAQMAAAERLRRDVFGIVPGIRCAVPGPLYHSAPNAFAMRAGRVARTMVLMPRFDPVGLLELIERERLDTMFMVPTMFIRLLKLPEDVRRRYDVSSLKFIIHAAAPCPHDVKTAMIEWWGPVINEFYGSTESSAVTLATSADTLAKPGTVGRAVRGRRAAHPRRRRAHPARGRGRRDLHALRRAARLHLPQQARRARPDRPRGLHHVRRRRLSRRRRLPLPVRPQARHGDLRRRQHLPGRDRGRAARLAGVKDCAVFGIPDAEFGERLMAVVEPADGAALTPADVRRYLRAHLADYKVPKSIEIARNLPRED